VEKRRVAHAFTWGGACAAGSAHPVPQYIDTLETVGAETTELDLDFTPLEVALGNKEVS
jgi:hypothetical protein